MDALNNFYTKLGDMIRGEYGFYNAFSIQNNWFPQWYTATEQGPVVDMIENYRCGLLWKLFMSFPVVQSVLNKPGFNSQWISH